MIAPRRAGAWFGLALMAASSAGATGPDWTAEKCRRDTAAWTTVSEGVALSPGFLAAHDAFLASGCTLRAAVCPQTDPERALADMLTRMIVAEGATVSFRPVHCDAGD